MWFSVPEREIKSGSVAGSDIGTVSSQIPSTPCFVKHDLTKTLTCDGQNSVTSSLLNGRTALLLNDKCYHGIWKSAQTHLCHLCFKLLEARDEGGLEIKHQHCHHLAVLLVIGGSVPKALLPTYQSENATQNSSKAGLSFLSERVPSLFLWTIWTA